MTDKEKYTQKLMDAVGGIDEKYINEAQNYTPKKRMPGYVKAMIAAAASILLIFGVSVPVLFSSLMARIKSGQTAFNNAYPETPQHSISQNPSQADAYDNALKTDGAEIIWRTENEGYRSVSISEEKAEAIIQSIGTNGEPPEKDDGLRIWIKTGDGLYISPQLKRSPGNTNCAIFEYSPEIAISDKAANMISDIINERG